MKRSSFLKSLLVIPFAPEIIKVVEKKPEKVERFEKVEAIFKQVAEKIKGQDQIYWYSQYQYSHPSLELHKKLWNNDHLR